MAQCYFDSETTVYCDEDSNERTLKRLLLEEEEVSAAADTLITDSDFCFQEVKKELPKLSTVVVKDGGRGSSCYCRQEVELKSEKGAVECRVVTPDGGGGGGGRGDVVAVLLGGDDKGKIVDENGRGERNENGRGERNNDRRGERYEDRGGGDRVKLGLGIGIPLLLLVLAFLAFWLLKKKGWRPNWNLRRRRNWAAQRNIPLSVDNPYYSPYPPAPPIPPRPSVALVTVHSPSIPPRPQQPTEEEVKEKEERAKKDAEEQKYAVKRLIEDADFQLDLMSTPRHLNLSDVAATAAAAEETEVKTRLDETDEPIITLVGEIKVENGEREAAEPELVGKSTGVDSDTNFAAEEEKNNESGREIGNSAEEEEKEEADEQGETPQPPRRKSERPKKTPRRYDEEFLNCN